MFCKFCGNLIDRKTMKCVSCGKPVGSLSGGNSFKYAFQSKANVASTPEVASGKSDPQIAHIAADIREIKKTISQKRINVAAIISTFCVLICLISLVSVFVLSGRNKRVLDGLDESIAAQFAATSQQLDDIKAVLDSTENKDNVPAASTPTFFSIDKEPESVTNVTSGRTNVAFICKASGEGLRFSWIKYSPTRNAWGIIEDDESRFEVVSSANESSLKVINASNEHEGTYICVIEDQNGQLHYSSPVQFSLAPSFTGNSDDLNSNNDNSPTTDKTSDSVQNNGLSYPFGGQS